jgi:hypothetical protein
VYVTGAVFLVCAATIGRAGLGHVGGADSRGSSQTTGGAQAIPPDAGCLAPPTYDARHRRHGRIAYMPTLLIVHHTPSPSLQAMFEAVVAGATNEEIEGVEVVRRPALAATAVDVLAAAAVIVGTPANIGYMSGALKHFFDQIYYPCLDATKKLPYAAYVHGNNDTVGAVLAIESIATGLSWQRVFQPVTVTGAPTKADLEACWELGATVAAGLMP